MTEVSKTSYDSEEQTEFAEFAKRIEISGPLHLVRGLCRYGRSKGAISVSYHVSPMFQAYGDSSHTFYATRNAFSRHSPDPEIKRGLGLCHKRVLGQARPVTMETMLPSFMEEEPALTKKMLAMLQGLGIFDAFMIPVYGPYNINGVISFGFSQSCSNLQAVDRFRLEAVSSSIHHRLVRYYMNSTREKDLSARELEVLKWISRGKTRLEISMILDLQPASVDTYTRRIFKKLGVNDRVSAALTAVFEGVLDP